MAVSGPSSASDPTPAPLPQAGGGNRARRTGPGVGAVVGAGAGARAETVKGRAVGGAGGKAGRPAVVRVVGRELRLRAALQPRKVCRESSVWGVSLQLNSTIRDVALPGWGIDRVFNGFP